MHCTRREITEKMEKRYTPLKVAKEKKANGRIKSCKLWKMHWKRKQTAKNTDTLSSSEFLFMTLIHKP